MYEDTVVKEGVVLWPEPCSDRNPCMIAGYGCARDEDVAVVRLQRSINLC